MGNAHRLQETQTFPVNLEDFDGRNATAVNVQRPSLEVRAQKAGGILVNDLW